MNSIDVSHVSIFDIYEMSQFHILSYMSTYIKIISYIKIAIRLGIYLTHKMHAHNPRYFLSIVLASDRRSGIK